MIVSPRAQQASPPPVPSYYSRQRSLSPTKTPASPPTTPPGKRRPSIHSTMTWLSRNSSSVSNRSVLTVSKPIRISEPKFNHTLDMYNPTRSGPLGAGATIVRTPQEALASGSESEQGMDAEECSEDSVSSASHNRELPSPPESPPFSEASLSKSSLDLPTRESPPKPTRAPPPPPVDLEPTPFPKRPALKMDPPSSGYFSHPPVPSLPANIPSSPIQPPFDPVLLSSVPSNAIDRSKIIVSIETDTKTYRTRLSTLTSRPSYLSTYLMSLLRPRHESDASSIYSNISDIQDNTFNSIFHNHLTSSGLLPQSSSSLHIFLDRPSAPYEHILTYLRFPPSSPESPTILPRAVQLTSSSSSRLESLLQLRDEARYLDLDELYKLCSDEIRTREEATTLHSRGTSSASSSGASLRSVRTFRERLEHEQRIRDSTDTTKSNFSSHGPNEMGVITSCTTGGTTTPGGGSRGRTSHPPVGWI